MELTKEKLRSDLDTKEKVATKTKQSNKMLPLLALGGIGLLLASTLSTEDENAWTKEHVKDDDNIFVAGHDYLPHSKTKGIVIGYAGCRPFMGVGFEEISFVLLDKHTGEYEDSMLCLGIKHGTTGHYEIMFTDPHNGKYATEFRYIVPAHSPEEARLYLMLVIASYLNRWREDLDPGAQEMFTSLGEVSNKLAEFVYNRMEVVKATA